MIAFFPELYEDELAYSWFSRYYTKSGYLSLRYALDDLYVKRYVNPDTEFVNELRPEVKELVIKHCGMEKLILGHTMFSSYGRFLPDAKKQEELAARVCREDLSVRQLEKLLKQEKSADKKEDKTPDKAWLYESIGTQIRDILGTKVHIIP